MTVVLFPEYPTAEELERQRQQEEHHERTMEKIKRFNVRFNQLLEDVEMLKAESEAQSKSCTIL